jgi:uncharacterized protein
MEAIETVEGLYAALESEDIGPFLDLCADDVEILYPGEGALAYGGRWTGRDGAARFLETHDAEEEILEFSPGHMVTDGSDVIVQGVFRGRGKATGREWSTEFVHVMTVSDGRLARWKGFFDTAAAVEARRSAAT